MSVGQDLVGKIFQPGQYSTGTVNSESTDPIQYTEQDDAPGSQYGASTITITMVQTDDTGVTTITGDVQTDYGTFTASGRLVGNDTDDFLIYGSIQTPIGNVTGYFFLTNEPPANTGSGTSSAQSPSSSSVEYETAVMPASSGGQPGVGNTALVRPESANIAYDPNSGTTCFVTGTAVTTSRGDVAVEQLMIGDIVETVTGRKRRVVWLGHRVIACTYATQPVRVCAHAFGADKPARDLWLSPGHPVLVGADEDGEGGHLVPIMCLINGTTIERVPVDEVTYWHIELDEHDILLAEGLPAESYLDWGDRSFFSECADHALANPDFVVPGLAGRCRPVAINGPVVEAERRRLDMEFAARLAGAAAWPNTQNALLKLF